MLSKHISFVITSLLLIISSSSSPSHINPNGPSSLTISSQSPSESSTISLKLNHTDMLYSLGITNEVFLLQLPNTPFLTISPKGNKTIITGKSILSNSLQLKGSLNYRKISQWRMVVYDSFKGNLTSLDWSYDKTSQCKGNHLMLGGYCQVSSEELVKTFKDLPQHEMMKIEGVYHAIGHWEQNTGYMKIKQAEGKEEKYLWTKRCKSIDNDNHSEDICDYKTCSIGNVINVSFKHSDNQVKIAFGATLTKPPCEQSYGISDIKIFIR